MKPVPSEETTTWAFFISVASVELTFAASSATESSLVVVTGAMSVEENRAPSFVMRDVESGTASLAVASASTLTPASVREAVVACPSAVMVTVAASARERTRSTTSARVMPATEVPATDVWGSAREE